MLDVELDLEIEERGGIASPSLFLKIYRFSVREYLLSLVFAQVLVFAIS